MRCGVGKMGFMTNHHSFFTAEQRRSRNEMLIQDVKRYTMSLPMFERLRMSIGSGFLAYLVKPENQIKYVDNRL